MEPLVSSVIAFVVNVIDEDGCVPKNNWSHWFQTFRDPRFSYEAEWADGQEGAPTPMLGPLLVV